MKANFLMSPMLVVAFALAGRVDMDLTTEPVGHDPRRAAGASQGHLAERGRGRRRCSAKHVKPRCFRRRVQPDLQGRRILAARSPVPTGSTTYAWDDASTYIRKPPYFDGFAAGNRPLARTSRSARVLVLLGDSVTTDHISPAGAIPADCPAGQYLHRAAASRSRISTPTAPAAATTRS
ncbi:MAG: hypothetical protein MZV70_62895 [Desulfobacterales bacterium]|nr:hypothetical protein [Desulfobacterales bacterium]